MALNGKDFAVSIAINGIIFLVCVFVFSFLRINKRSARFYSPKWYLRLGEELLRQDLILNAYCSVIRGRIVKGSEDGKAGCQHMPLASCSMNLSHEKLAQQCICCTCLGHICHASMTCT